MGPGRRAVRLPGLPMQYTPVVASFWLLCSEAGTSGEFITGEPLEGEPREPRRDEIIVTKSDTWVFV